MGQNASHKNGNDNFMLNYFRTSRIFYLFLLFFAQSHIAEADFRILLFVLKSSQTNVTRHFLHQNIKSWNFRLIRKISSLFLHIKWDSSGISNIINLESIFSALLEKLCIEFIALDEIWKCKDLRKIFVLQTQLNAIYLRPIQSRLKMESSKTDIWIKFFCCLDVVNGTKIAQFGALDNC